MRHDHCPRNPAWCLASHAPHIEEPFMLTFDGSAHYRVAMAPEELQSAGLERVRRDLMALGPSADEGMNR